MPTLAVNNFLRRWTNPTDRLLVAVSGGADSMGLLSILSRELGYDSERLVVGHVDHGLRDDAPLDRRLVEEVSESWGLDVFSRRIDTKEFARERRKSVELAARELRYRALHDMARQSSAKWVLTAHTLDDSAETVLMRMLSGAPWYEWTGIPHRRGAILRPLLMTTRADLRDYVKKLAVPYREDYTNQDINKRRNRLRAVLQTHPPPRPFMDRMGQLAQAGVRLGEALHVLRHASTLLFRECVDGDSSGTIRVEIEDIFGYFKSLAFLPVEAAWGRLAGSPDSRLPSALRRQLTDCLRGSTPQAVVRLPHGVTFERRGGHAWVYRGSTPTIERHVSPGVTAIPELGARLVIAGRNEDARRGDGGRADAVVVGSGRLVVRNWRPGDRLRPPGRPNKKISDLLAELDLDPLRRACTLVLVDDNGPLMILGGPVDVRAIPKAEDEHVWVSWTVDE